MASEQEEPPKPAPCRLEMLSVRLETGGIVMLPFDSVTLGENWMGPHATKATKMVLTWHDGVPLLSLT